MSSGDTGLPGLPAEGTTGGPDSGIPTGPPIFSTTQDIACPDEPTDIPKDHIDRYFRDAYCALKKYNLGHLVTSLGALAVVAPAAALLALKDIVLAIAVVWVPPFANVALSIIDGMRKTMDTQFAQMGVVVLGELMGADLDPSDIPVGGDFTQHIARAERVGSIFHNLLFAEFSGAVNLTPEAGVKAAETFSGLVINFGTATGVIAALGGLFPYVHLDELRQIGEEVARNLGLGRLHRVAMTPIFKTLMATPYQWYLNLKLRPTQFTLVDVANPFSGATMGAQIIHDSLAREGYSDDKIAALIALHQKKLPFTDLFKLHQRKILSDDQYAKLASEQGIPDDQRGYWELIQLWAQEKTWEDEVVSAAADAYKFGNITRDELNTVASTFLHDPVQVTLFMASQDYKRKVPHRSLTVAQLEAFFVDGIFTLDDFDNRIAALGFSEEDAAALRLVTLEKLQTAEAKAAAAKQKAASAAAKAAKKSSSTTPPPTSAT